MSESPIRAVAAIKTYFLFSLSEMIPETGLANRAVIENMPTMTPAAGTDAPRCNAYFESKGMTM